MKLFVDLERPGSCASVIDHAGRELAVVDCGQITVTDNISNAHLFAAAPELLEALDRFVKYTRVRTMENATMQEYANLQVLVSLADDAIKKARGEV